MKVFEESLYKEQEKVEALEKELETIKVAHHELEEKYADVSCFYSSLRSARVSVFITLVLQ